jgi:predicted small metal-binding protein
MILDSAKRCRDRRRGSIRSVRLAKRITRCTISFVSEVTKMGFTVKCPVCSTQMNAETMDDLMKQGMEHAKTAHGMTSIPPTVLAQLQAAVKKT